MTITLNYAARTINADPYLIDIFDDVVDGTMSQAKLQQVAEQLYADRRGGRLAPLWSSEEFISRLREQLPA